MTRTLRMKGLLALAGVLVTVGTTTVIVREKQRAHRSRVLGEKIVGGGSSSPNGAAGSKAFLISGQVTGLYPGADRPLVLRLDNPNGADITVDSVTVSAVDAPPGCAAAALSFSGFKPVKVPGKGSATLTLTTHMSDTAANRCANSTWTLDYSGTAFK